MTACLPCHLMTSQVNCIRLIVLRIIKTDNKIDPDRGPLDVNEIPFIEETELNSTVFKVTVTSIVVEQGCFQTELRIAGNSNKLIGRFRVPLWLCFKASLSAKPFL